MAQVGIALHLDPSLAYTVHIEPLTPADWESKSISRALSIKTANSKS